MATPGIDAPIGIFDSGVGGLTVARAVIDQLPAEQDAAPQEEHDERQDDLRAAVGEEAADE